MPRATATFTTPGPDVRREPIDFQGPIRAPCPT
jgi:hypothetical protein